MSFIADKIVMDGLTYDDAKEVAELFEKEITKLERLNPAVAEYSVQMAPCRHTSLHFHVSLHHILYFPSI